MEKKRHHFIAQAYLRPFCNAEGKVITYFKEKGGECVPMATDAIGFEKYYYSQPTPEGGQDNNALENMFAEIENRWPALVAKMTARKRLEPNEMVDVLEFVTMQHVRVPTARDAAEQHLAQQVLLKARELDREGKLPPKPAGHGDILDSAVVAIDPHQSLHAMVPMALSMGPRLDAIGYEIVENDGSIDFLTSDNPVIYFNAGVPEQAMLPYNLEGASAIELLFPLTPRHVLRGANNLREYYRRLGLRFGTRAAAHDVRRINRLVARFATRFVFGSTDRHVALVKKHADRSPVIQLGEEQTMTLPLKMKFGERIQKPKWTK